jgi:hypothetical protein
VKRRAAIVAVCALLGLLLGELPCAAEEGLFVARLAGGFSMVHPDMPEVGGAIVAAADYGFTERLGAIGSGLVILHDRAKSLGLGLGFRGLLVEQRWWRLYLHVGPELLLVWRPERDIRVDLSFRAGLGVEYLIVWGVGLVLELYGQAPMGLGDAPFLDGASTGAVLGLFMEF